MKKNKNLTEEEIAELKKGPTDKINPYKKTGILSRIPFPIKSLLFKWWAYGAGVFFIFFGTTNLILGDTELNPTTNQAQMYILAILLALFNGIVSDVVVYHFIDLMDDETKMAKYFVIFHSKKLYSLFINLVYQIFISYICLVIFDNTAAFWDLILDFDTKLGFHLYIEPVTYGMLLLGIDMLFILIKNLIVKIVKKLKNRKGSKNV